MKLLRQARAHCVWGPAFVLHCAGSVLFTLALFAAIGVMFVVGLALVLVMLAARLGDWLFVRLLVLTGRGWSLWTEGMDGITRLARSAKAVTGRFCRVVDRLAGTRNGSVRVQSTDAHGNVDLLRPVQDDRPLQAHGSTDQTRGAA